MCVGGGGGHCPFPTFATILNPWIWLPGLAIDKSSFGGLVRIPHSFPFYMDGPLPPNALGNL